MCMEVRVRSQSQERGGGAGNGEFEVELCSYPACQGSSALREGVVSVLAAQYPRLRPVLPCFRPCVRLEDTQMSCGEVCYLSPMSQ
jgi:hypothetical protein